MVHTHRATITASCLVTLLTLASPASAQFFGQASDLPIGEDYHVEVLGGLWSPTPKIQLSSDEFGIAGTSIDFASDLGIGQQRFGELRLRLRPGRKHRFRIDYVPIRYSAQSVVERRLVFRGIAFDVGVPVTSAITWNTWRLGYEYDIVHRSRGYFGIILEAKYTDVEASLDTELGREFARARGPIPAIGGVLRIYPLRALGITAEITGFRVPEGIDENVRGEYVDLDLYGTLNFTEQLGAQIGYRSLDLSYLVDQDSGNLELGGIYFAALFRF
ncbi:MAG: hypothetical protein QF681_04955 [Vicinamibacterales bacterium]|jgi:hypothetical protein|nr:hypothetical protein [Vicinamibacterales bacterium]